MRIFTHKVLVYAGSDHDGEVCMTNQPFIKSYTQVIQFPIFFLICICIYVTLSFM